ncbi:MAG: hypothetical protein IJT77_07590 [Clostridia bacterium]|nr:hypothetical protein [Clostridia bacterium]
MKKEYYSTFLPGLEEPVAALLRHTGGVSVTRMMPGAVVYRSVREPHIACVQRTYQVLAEMKTEKNLDAALRRLSASDAFMDRFDFESIAGLRFRIVTAVDGQPCAANMRYVSMMEKTICEQTGMQVSRERPQVELWVNLRQEGLYFLWRMDKREGQKNADPLRRDLCETIASLGRVQGGQAAVLGLTGTNLPDALKAQGAASVNAVLADHVKGAAADVLRKTVRLQSGSPGCCGLSDHSQNAVFVCLAPKGSYSIQEEALRSTIREAVRILKADGRLVVFYPKAQERVFRRLGEQERLGAYRVTVSGEECRLEVFNVVDDADQN